MCSSPAPASSTLTAHRAAAVRGRANDELVISGLRCESSGGHGDRSVGGDGACLVRTVCHTPHSAEAWQTSVKIQKKGTRGFGTAPPDAQSPLPVVTHMPPLDSWQYEEPEVMVNGSVKVGNGANGGGEGCGGEGEEGGGGWSPGGGDVGGGGSREGGGDARQSVPSYPHTKLLHALSHAPSLI